MRTLHTITAAGIAWIAATAPALAHPGHGPDGGDWSLAHYLREPAHALVAVSLLVVAALAARFSQEAREIATRNAWPLSRLRARRSAPGPRAASHPAAADPAR